MYTRYASRYNRCDILNESSYDLGDLVLIHGSVLHKSERNISAHTRFAYTFHMIESLPYAEYDAKNWLQPTPVTPFPHILDAPNTTVIPVGA